MTSYQKFVQKHKNLDKVIDFFIVKEFKNGHMFTYKIDPKDLRKKTLIKKIPVKATYIDWLDNKEKKFSTTFFAVRQLSTISLIFQFWNKSTIGNNARLFYDVAISLKSEIKFEKSQTRYIPIQKTQFGIKIGEVYQFKQAILNYHKSSKEHKLSLDKTPWNKKNHLGIEIECFVNCTQKRLEEQFIENNLEKNVQVKDDGSLHWHNPDCQDCCSCEEGFCEMENCSHSCGYNPVEIVVMANEENYKQILTKVCKILNSFDAKVNKTCGLHIHLDQRNRDHKKSYTALVLSLPLLQQLVPQSRRENSYCRANSIPYFDQHAEGNEGNRYWAINTDAYNKHKTLEVRLHSGTTDRVKITRWIETLLYCMNEQIITDKRLSNWIEERIQKFAPKISRKTKKLSFTGITSANSMEYEYRTITGDVVSIVNYDINHTINNSVEDNSEAGDNNIAA